jgi:enoyl-CoA hydratase/carnithine racemase
MAAPKYETLEIDQRGPICILSIDCPDKLNALSYKMIADLNHFFAGMRYDTDTRVIIFRGNGKAFCAGSNLDDLAMDPPEGMGRVQRDFFIMQQSVTDIILHMRRCAQPIIGAIHGFAIGGGFSIALACDVRIAGESVRMNAGYIKIGTSGCDMGSSFHLPRIIGFSRAAEYLYTGRFMDAATADRLGLVSKVVPDDKLLDAALELAQEMLLTSPFGLRLSKEGLNASMDGLSLENAIKMENRNQVLCTSTADGKEGIKAMMEKRKPAFRNL